MNGMQNRLKFWGLGLQKVIFIRFLGNS